jgi:hypothetical protein
MAYVPYDWEFWQEVAVSFTEQFGIHRENVPTSQSTIGEGWDHLDPETLYMLARAAGVGVSYVEDKCWVGKGGWTPAFTADRLHRRLQLR